MVSTCQITQRKNPEETVGLQRLRYHQFLVVCLACWFWLLKLAFHYIDCFVLLKIGEDIRVSQVSNLLEEGNLSEGRKSLREAKGAFPFLRLRSNLFKMPIYLKLVQQKNIKK